MNSVNLIGRITKDPELRRTQSGNAVVSFTLAVDNRHKEDGADFPICVAWNQVAELVAKYVRKGHKIAVSGKLQTRSYESKGNKHFITEVIVETVDFLEKKELEPDEDSNLPF